VRGGSLEARVADIGMWIAAPFAGQGLGTRALRLLLRWGFDAWPWERLTWHCDTRNFASARVAEKAGMTLEGTLRQNVLDSGGQRHDTRLYAMLKSEWAG
jgi:RimJ/RimL family protein N-acetyltransferase